jgi:hypothetical protein
MPYICIHQLIGYLKLLFSWIVYLLDIIVKGIIGVLFTSTLLVYFHELRNGGNKSHLSKIYDYLSNLVVRWRIWGRNPPPPNNVHYKIKYILQYLSLKVDAKNYIFCNGFLWLLLINNYLT